MNWYRGLQRIALVWSLGSLCFIVVVICVDGSKAVLGLGNGLGIFFIIIWPWILLGLFIGIIIPVFTYIVKGFTDSPKPIQPPPIQPESVSLPLSEARIPVSPPLPETPIQSSSEKTVIGTVNSKLPEKKKKWIPNTVFAIAFFIIWGYYYNSIALIDAFFRALGFCVVMIPFLIGYNTLKKDSTVKNIMGNAVIGIAIVVIFAFIIFAFNANTIYDNNKWSAQIKQYNEAADRGKENVNSASAKSVQSVSHVEGYEGNGADRTGSNQQTKQHALDNNVAISFRVLSGGSIGLSDVTSQPRFEYMLDNFGDGKRTARQIRDAALNAGDAELAARLQFDVAKLMIQNGDWIGQVPSDMSQVSPVPAVSTPHPAVSTQPPIVSVAPPVVSAPVPVVNETVEKQTALGDQYYRENDFYRATEYYKKAAERGHAAAQYSLGCCYAAGQGVMKTPVLAVQWWEKASEQGIASAQFNLGTCYEQGYGSIAKDKKEAIKWYQKAAAGGHDGAAKALKSLKVY